MSMWPQNVPTGFSRKVGGVGLERRGGWIRRFVLFNCVIFHGSESPDSAAARRSFYLGVPKEKREQAVVSRACLRKFETYVMWSCGGS